MDVDKRRAIASLGGMAAQSSGKGRRWTAEEAKEAAKLGGEAYKRKMALLPSKPKASTFVYCHACTAANGAGRDVYHKPPHCSYLNTEGAL